MAFQVLMTIALQADAGYPSEVIAEYIQSAFDIPLGTLEIVEAVELFAENGIMLQL